jgi:nitrile hydratase subunit alpha
LLTEKGLVPDGFIEEVNRVYENDIGPMNGARVVARAWVDAEDKARLLESAQLPWPSSASADQKTTSSPLLTPRACTTWWFARSAPAIPGRSSASHPVGTRNPPYRARMVREPRVLLKEMGCDVPADVDVRVWDSSAEVRYLVVPERPAGTEDLSEEELAELVTRDSMIGVARL